MPTADDWRRKRLTRLHDRFGDAAEKHPRVFHFAAKFKKAEHLKELLPWAESHFVFAEQWRDDPTDISHHERKVRECWTIVLDSLAADLSPWLVDHHLMSFGGECWIGAFGIERNDERELEPRPEIDLFAELATEAANEFTDVPPVQKMPGGGWQSLKFDRTDSRWLSLVYSQLAPQPQQVHSAITAMWLPFNVFTSSEKALEEIMRSESNSLGPTSSGVTAAPAQQTREPAASSQVTERTTTTLKQPSDDALAAYRIWTLLGLKQQEIADQLTGKFKRPFHQGSVSRMLKQVKQFLEAGGVVPPPRPEVTSVESVDPTIIDKGARQDHQTRRQRRRQTSDE